MARRTLEREVTVFRQQRTGYAQIGPEHEIKTVSVGRRRGLANAVNYYFQNPRYRTGRRTRFDDAHRTICRDIAPKLEKKLGRRVIERLQSFARREGEPFIIIRNVLPAPMGFPDDPWRFEDLIANQDENDFLIRAQKRMRAIDTVLGALLWTLNTTPEPRFPTSSNRRGVNFLTRWDVQEQFDTKSADMPLRFHQSTVEKPLPEHDRPKLSDAALFKAYGAIRNPRRTPILILKVDTVLDHLDDAVIDPDGNRTARDVLSSPNFTKIGPRLELSDGPEMGHNGRILSTLNGRDIMGFDAARVWPVENNRLCVLAVQALRDAIHHASRKDACEIKLHRHDVLLVDNLRAMIARPEDKPEVFDLPAALDKYKRRWLRVMYGFALDESAAPPDGRNFSGRAPSLGEAPGLNAHDGQSVP